MLEMPLFIRPNLKALAGGVFAYALLYWFSTAGTVAFSHLWFPSSSPGELKLLYADSSLSKFFAGVVFMQYGFARMDLTTAKTNFSAQSLYESLGWVRDDIFHAYSKRVGG